jgi:hypothetical protein
MNYPSFTAVPYLPYQRVSTHYEKVTFYHHDNHKDCSDDNRLVHEVDTL